MELQDRYIDRIKKAMNDNEINARELSRRCGLSEASISRYLSGNMTPRLPAIKKMAEALHVDPMWLMGYDNISPDFSIETGKIAMLIECMTPAERSQVDKYVKFIISQRGNADE